MAPHSSCSPPRCRCPSRCGRSVAARRAQWFADVRRPGHLRRMFPPMTTRPSPRRRQTRTRPAGGLSSLPRDIPNSLRRRVATLVRPQSHLRYVTGLREVLRSLDVTSFDVVHVEHLFTAHALDDFDRAVINLHFLDVLDWAGRDHMSAWERVYYLQAKRATPPMLRKTTRLTASTDRVADAAVLLGARARPLVVPLSLDTTLYSAVPRTTEPVVGVIGSMDWYPSRAAAIRVLTTLWPRIHAARPDARLVVAGRNSQQFLGEHFPVEGAQAHRRGRPSARLLRSGERAALPTAAGERRQDQSAGGPCVRRTRGHERRGLRGRQR